MRQAWEPETHTRSVAQLRLLDRVVCVPSGREETVAIIVELTPFPGRTAGPSGHHHESPPTNLSAHSPRNVNPLTTAQHDTSQSTTTQYYFGSSAQPPSRGALCRAFPKRWESLERAFNSHKSWAILCRYRCQILPAEVPRLGSDRNIIETASTAVGGGRSSRSRWKKSGTGAHRTTNQRKENRAAADRRTAW